MLLSRVADALYWISRYLERAEHTIRLIDVRLDLGLDRRPDGWEFDGLYASLSIGPEVRRPAQPRALMDSLVFDLENRASVAACVNAARENARQVREEISGEMWQQINELFLRLKQARPDMRSRRPNTWARLVINGIHLFQGVTDATMGHGEGWQYLQAGRFIERVGATAALLDRHVGQGTALTAEAPGDRVEWVGLLRSCAALEAYCRCYTADLQVARIVEFLLLNPEFPHSIRFAASRVESALRTLAQHTSRPAGGPAERWAGRLHALLSYGQVDEIQQDPHGYFDSVKRHCALVDAALHQTYIGYRVESALPA